MVMKKNAMRRNLRQSIIKSIGRYIAITAIIMLGAGLFLGLVMTKTDMVATGQKFVDEQNMFDLRMVSNYGWGQEYVDEFAVLSGVEAAEGQINMDLIASVEHESDSVYRFYSIPKTINRLALRAGRMPESVNECLADGYLNDESMIGKQVILSQENEDDSLESVTQRTFTVVGLVATPLYMDMNRGTTSVGSGVLENYFFVPEEAFDVDYFTEIYLKLEGKHTIYSKAYSDVLDKAVDVLEPDAEDLAQRRFDELKAEIEEEYQEGYQEYLDGLKEYEDGKAEAEQELADAEQELIDGEKKLEDARIQLVNGGREIEAGYKKLEQGMALLDAAKAEFAATKPGALAQIAAERAKLDANAADVEAKYNTAMQEIGAAQQTLTQAGAAAAEIPALKAKLEELNTSGDLAAAAEIQNKITALESAYATAQQNMNAVSAQHQDAIQNKYTADATYAYLAEQEQQLAAAEAQLEDQEKQLKENKKLLDGADEMLMINWGKWGKSRDELADGWIEFEDAKIEVAQELADAEAELKDAEEELREAREEIDSMEEPDLFILDRESNLGYNNLNSSSDIVAGVSKVFPVFFLLIASLVCITTMTRMIDEERIQIGTLKALGYTNGEIISKYLIYSGSGAVIGCVLGILLGCSIFPMIIWEAYKIMLYIQPDIVLTVNWWLAIAVSVSYLTVMLAVTWYCCYKTLQEEPAQLIRPKAPQVGKKILLEELPVWHKLKFLNKVVLRNIFRYRQRLAMMMIGIGGCTALLIAGFGLRDSIMHIVDYQFQDVTHYDLAVYFREEPSEKERKKFEKVIQNAADDFLYYHQSSVELDNGDRIKELYMISADSQLEDFITMSKSGVAVELPGRDEVVLTVGVAENLGIRVGDAVTVRSADLDVLELTVSGIYENYIDNYCLVSPETITDQWGESPKQQMAFVTVKDGAQIHAVSAAITDLDCVLNVSISEDMADMVGSMMAALDLVVMVAVFCAALLAVIVLYNLTNININERIREIATIKVLGFNAGETASYVFKENMVLTVAGSVFGLLLGWLLLEFIMLQVKIDTVWFRTVLTPASCALAVVLTLLSAVVVEFVFYFKLEKINMAEALKSVE